MEDLNQDLDALEMPTDSVEQLVMKFKVDEIVQVNDTLHRKLKKAEKEIEQQRAVIEVQRAHARTDSLTGLPNRRAFDDELARQFKDMEKDETPVSLLFIDVDHFKKFNDQYGHQAGDAVLKGVADALVESLRDVDVVTRYGGEEFAAVLPGADLKKAQALAEKAREAVANQPGRCRRARAQGDHQRRRRGSEPR